MARGLLRSSGVEATLLQASLALFGFALLGYIVGRLASWIVEESVRGSVVRPSRAQQAAKPKGATQTGQTGATLTPIAGGVPG